MSNRQFVMLASRVLLAFFWLKAEAAPVRMDCPASLAKASVKVSAPTGWTGNVPDDLMLAGAGMMSGPPESEEYLIPAAQSRKGLTSTQTWRFEPLGEKWLMCGYGSAAGGAAAVQIGLRVDDSVHSCTLTRSAQDPRPTYALRCD